MTTLRVLLRLAAALAFLPTAAAAIELQPVQVAARSWYFIGEAGIATATNEAFNSNAGFVVTGAGVVVIDALGSPALGAAIRRAVARVTAQPIVRVIVTHYHADHYYGLQGLREDGVEIWAHEKGRVTLGDPAVQERLEQRRRDLAPWIDARTRLVPADRWIDFRAGPEQAFELGGVRFRLIDVSGAHSADDLMVWVEDDRALFAGDLYFSGRLPFVGGADSRAWLRALGRIEPLRPAVVIPGHGRASSDPRADIALTREYLQFLRERMGEAVRDMKSFDEAYAQVDWSRYAGLPAFEPGNRINAYGTFLRMEQEALGQ